MKTKQIKNYVNKSSKHLFKIKGSDKLLKVYLDGDNVIKVIFEGDSHTIQKISIEYLNEWNSNNALCVLKHWIFYPENTHISIKKIKRIEESLNLIKNKV